MTIEEIAAAMRRPLPGREAQRRMMIHPRPGGFAPPQDDAPKEGGVMILLYPVAGASPKTGTWHLPLIRRTEYEGAHSGQISLPGGRRENGETLAQTALRETREELGVPAEGVHLLGSLTSLYIPASGYSITPFVGHLASRPAFHTDAKEVRDLLEVPLSLFLEETTVAVETWHFGTFPVQVPFYGVSEHKVWGATAMVLSEFAAVLRRGGDPVVTGENDG